MSRPPNFNTIARPYRWLEYLTLGQRLQRCRTWFLPQLLHRKRALVLGDGDGRFLAALLAANSEVRAIAVDSSSVMLHLLRDRCEAVSSGRLSTHHTNALDYSPGTHFDLIVTNFFLDCLTQSELDRLVSNLALHLPPGGLWLFSDFRIPRGHLRPVAKLLIASLYLAFRILTGLRTRCLPRHHEAFSLAGLDLMSEHRSFGGILTTQLWQVPPAPPR